jgi:P4 family phage/plasmid primase-like protien
MTQITFTRFNSKQLLTKTFSLVDSNVHKQAAANMYSGDAERVRMPFADFAQALAQATKNEAFGYGITDDLFYRDKVQIVVGGKENEAQGILSRSKKYFEYRDAGVLMIDHDPSPYGKSYSPDELLSALLSVHPEIAKAARIVRGSVSAGVHLTGEAPRPGKGFHLYIPVPDASQIPDYGKLLFDRLWLAGHGFIALSANGALLDRSCIDGAVFSPERLDFVGAPNIVGEGIGYTTPEIDYTDGCALDLSTLPALSPDEVRRLGELKAAAVEAMQSAGVEQQGRWAEGRVAEMVSNGVPIEKATASIDATVNGGGQDLFEDFVLDFADGRTVSVGTVLSSPEEYDGKALADPIEGGVYGRTTAKFWWNDPKNDGKPCVNSFAHGGAKYFLHDNSTLFDALPGEPRALTSFNAPRLAGTDARDGTNNTRPLSELGNAFRLLDAHGDDLRYVNDAKTWLHWRGGNWAWDMDGALTRSLAADMHRAIYAEGAVHVAEGLQFAKWARASQEAKTVKNAVSLFSDFEDVRIPLSAIDNDPYLVGLNNAKSVLDLRTGRLRSARQDDYITKSLGIDRLGDSSQAKRWLSFLDQIFGGDQELIDWLQRWFGYMLTGSTQEHCFVFCYGLGSNGKGVLAETIKSIMGDYSRALGPETLTEMKRQAGAATPDLADLIGCRMALSTETEDGQALAESLVKSLVSGDSMTARKLYSSPVQYVPQFKLMMLGNHKPIIRGNDHGIWRRVRLIPFTRTFKDGDIDTGLPDKLQAEAPYILAWMVEGCLRWQRKGLADIPAAIREATAEYRKDQDILGQWLADRCEISLAIETPISILYPDYKAWSIDAGLHPQSKFKFGRKLVERGINVRPSNGATLYGGVGLAPRPDIADFESMRG